jgi:hypothetical protein
MWLDAVLLRGDKVKQRLRAAVELVKAAVAVRLAVTLGAVLLACARCVLLLALVEDREQERPLMERAVLDRVVQLRHTARVELFLLDVAEVLEELLPPLAEEEWLVATTPDSSVSAATTASSSALTIGPESCRRP